MNSLLNYLKKSNISVPPFIGKQLGKVPFSMRPGLGGIYKTQFNAINSFNAFSQKQKEEYIFKNFYKVFQHAYLNVPFYSDLYKSVGISLNDINEFSDIKNIPIISKKDLINVPLKDRSFLVNNRFLVNTGGSSGVPLSFYMDPLRYGNEWAHLHFIWSKLGYRPSSFKLSFDGRSTVKDLVQYDFVRNSFRVDIYADKQEVFNKLYLLANRYNIEFLHGYPSAISDFASNCERLHPKLAQKLRSTLKGAFLSSEFPAPHYRDIIENTFDIKTQSFYGHTETCVFAEEIKKFEYMAFQTYGFAEAVSGIDKTTTLVGTSYFNFASPLIRYNTQDLIEAPLQPILDSFKIKEGREGEYIIDRNNIKIPLTGLIFGRHHKLFDYCSHVQIRQNSLGTATILYVPTMSFSEPEKLFDSSNVNIAFQFEKLDKPVMTNSGKVKLLV